jgi:adenosylhomocysteine nucleosidase
MTAPLIFIAADARECADWVGYWSEVRDPHLPVHWSRAGNWQGRPMLALANGAGWDRAHDAVAVAVEAAGTVGAIYSVGYCGALDPSLQIGDIFLATEVRGSDDVWPAQLPQGPEGWCKTARTGPLASIFHIAQTALEKRQLRQTGAFVVEMEAAAVARASDTLNVPFYCVRVVSDLAEEDFANNFNKFLMSDGRISIPRLIFGAFGSPVARFGELIRLSKRASVASKNLGEFLAHVAY